VLTWDPENEERAVADARAKDVLVGVLTGIFVVAGGLAARGVQLWVCAS
jgi:hypothetical protein